MPDLRHLGITAAFMILPLTAGAHHGVSGQFDTSQTIEVAGQITRISMVNPHSYVYFDVVDAAGDVVNMRCELLSGSTLRRNGWTEEMFVIGSAISITGSPDHDDPTTCHMDRITFENGVTATRQSSFAEDGTVEAEERQTEREDGTPNITGNWAMVGRENRTGGRPNDALTAAGEAAVVGASPDQNPRFNCQVTNIAMDWWFNQMVNSITQTDTEITLNYGFMDLERTIYLDGRAMPDDFVPSRAGFSVGTWEGDTLVVTTTGFDEGWISAPIGGQRTSAPNRGNGGGERANRPERGEGGDRPERADRPEREGRPEGGRAGPQPIKNSLALTVTERFSLNDDGTVLSRTYTFVDPLHLEGPIEGSDNVTLTTDAFQTYDCDDLTNERTQ